MTTQVTTHSMSMLTRTGGRATMAFALALVAGLSFQAPARSASGDQQFAQLGECKLESGTSIKDCKVGYRTLGKLNPDKSNIVVALPYLTDSAGFVNVSFEQLRLIDTTRYYVVVIDPLSDGVSSSPSNSKAQPGDKFPRFTVKDMVNVQHRVLSETLGFQSVYAIFGSTEGGMEAFQWLVSYPTYMKKVIAAVATPKPTTSDMVFNTAATQLLESKPATDRERDLVNLGFAALWSQAGFNAEWYNSQANPADAESIVGNWIQSARNVHTKTPMSMLDSAARYREAATQDIYKDYGGSMDKAAQTIKARLLVIVADDNRFLQSAPSLELAKKLNASTLRLPTGGSGASFGVSADKIRSTIAEFLSAR